VGSFVKHGHAVFTVIFSLPGGGRKKSFDGAENPGKKVFVKLKPRRAAAGFQGLYGYNKQIMEAIF
jgi:hypothetical protein